MYVHTHTNCRNTPSSTHTHKEKVSSFLSPTSQARCLWPPQLLSHACDVPDIILCQVGVLLIQRRQNMPQPPMSTHPTQYVQMAGAYIVPLGGRQGWDLSTATLATPSTWACLGFPRLGTSTWQSELEGRSYNLGPGEKTV